MKSAALSIILSSIFIIPLFTMNLNAKYYPSDENCFTRVNPFYSLKIISITTLLLMIIYRIYFSLGWASTLSIPGDHSYVSMLREVMWLQRGYRTVVYGIIILISTILFSISSLIEYNQFKSCLNGNNDALDKVVNNNKYSFTCIGVIVISFIFEFNYIKGFVFNVAKNWNNIDYGMGKRSKLEWIFFFKRINVFQIVGFSIFFLFLFFCYKDL